MVVEDLYMLFHVPIVSDVNSDNKAISVANVPSKVESLP